MSTDGRRETTVTDLAEHFEVSRMTIYNWRDAGAPIDQGTEPLAAWLKINRPGDSPLQQRLLQARVEKMEADARAKQIENRVAVGEMVNRDAVERWLIQFVAATRALIEAWPEQCILELPGEFRIVVHDILSEQVRMLLNSLADMPAELFADETVATTATAPESVSP